MSNEDTTTDAPAATWRVEMASVTARQLLAVVEAAEFAAGGDKAGNERSAWLQTVAVDLARELCAELEGESNGRRQPR